jgi:hypothetical protein
MPFVSSVRGSFGLNRRPFPRFTITTTNSNITGGTISTSGGFRIHTFSTGSVAGGTYTFSVTPNESRNGTSLNFPVDFLIVGGGGGGGGHHGGGGGAGGVAIASSYNVGATGNFTVLVGRGGNGSIGRPSVGDGRNGTNYDGENSSVFGITGFGGGSGATCCGRDAGFGAETGRPGGSAGGSGAFNNGTSTQSRRQTTITQISGPGYTGYGNVASLATATPNNHVSGGGGGAGSPGSTVSFTDTSCINGSGGNGIASSISGSSVTYGGGGGGGNHGSSACRTGGSGGSGGGGAGAGNGSTSDNLCPTDGTNGLGGGGGGDSHSGCISGGSFGGSGIVIIRYPV